MKSVFRVPSDLPVEIHRHTLATPWTYRDLDRRQDEIATEINTAGAGGAILLSEVAPVITLGRRSTEGDFLASSQEIAKRGIELYPCSRGGLATYHGPGQWVLFIVEKLERLTGDSRGVRVAVEGLLEVGKSALCRFGFEAEIRNGTDAGIYGLDGRKVGSVGVHFRDRVLMHGLSLNGYETTESFFGIRPCGLSCGVGFPIQTQELQERESKFLSLKDALIETLQDV